MAYINYKVDKTTFFWIFISTGTPLSSDHRLKYKHDGLYYYTINNIPYK